MKLRSLPYILSLALACWPLCAPALTLLRSDDARLDATSAADGRYNVTFALGSDSINAATAYNPTCVIDAVQKVFYVTYDSYQLLGDSAVIFSRELLAEPYTTKFLITDRFVLRPQGAMELERDIKILELGSNSLTNGFYSSFGLEFSPQSDIMDADYFVPGVWYKTNFSAAGNLPGGVPTKSDTNFYYRDDRIPLPVMMMRHKGTGATATLVFEDSPCRTILADNSSQAISSQYRFCGVGMAKRSRTSSHTALVTYPGSDLRTGGIGKRYHPIDTSFSGHHYKVYFSLTNTPDYASALRQAWEKGCDLYNPTIYPVDLQHAFDALLSTCDSYYLAPNRPSTYRATRPGFPWSVNLNDFSLNKATYELGFVGSQPEAGYALYRGGCEKGNSTYKSHGKAVLDFWASESQTSLGLPRTRFAAMNGSWDGQGFPVSMRQAANGMVPLLEAWCYAYKNGNDYPAWLNAAERFGDFLISHQNADGSWYLDYDHTTITNGLHPAVHTSKYNTVCCLRFLAELYIATNDDRYRQCLDRAAEWCYKYNHQRYAYTTCVVDNPQTIDSESGQQALNGFLAMYDLTKEPRWLQAAEQAATYTESWVFQHEVPVEDDQTADTKWPRDRSIVGQHLIAVGHAACDLGNAWSSFCLYRLYLLTGREHYLKAARMSAHNSKQSMNLGQTLYPRQPEGLQPEAFQLRTKPGTSRRNEVVMEALTWNFAAHLDPMLRFLDAFGTPDLEAVEAMDPQTRAELNRRYGITQSADYGQELPGGITSTSADACSVKITDDNITVLGPSQSLTVYDLAGRTAAQTAASSLSLASLAPGCYLLSVISPSGNISKKFLK